MRQPRGFAADGQRPAAWATAHDRDPFPCGTGASEQHGPFHARDDA